MAKGRLVLVEFDGSDEALVSVLRASLPRETFEPLHPPPIPPELAAPAVETPRALPSVNTPAASPAPHAPPSPRRAGQPKRSAASAPAPAAESTQAEDSRVIAAVVASLQRGPLTSVEVIAKSGYSSGAVYPALKALREQGRVEMWDDEASAQRKNRLKA